MNKRYWLKTSAHALVLSVLAQTSFIGLAQAQPSDAEPDTAAEEPTTDAETEAEPKSTEQRLKELEELVQSQQEQLEQEKEAAEKPADDERVEALEAEVKSLRDELEMAQALEEQRMEQSLDEEGLDDRKLTAYGFFDLTFVKTWLDPQENILNLNAFPEGSFTMGGVNVYLKSQMSQTLSALIETRLTFLPNGRVQDSYINLESNGTVTPISTQYVRSDTTTQGPLSLQQYRPGGVLIERAHVDWQPHSLFNVRLGRFLTNYGIWNIDHGSPTLIGVLPPALVSAQVIPNWLTGAEVTSNLSISDSTILHAGVSLSNGRGPIDEWHDLDANKALTARLRVSYENQKTAFALGAFGYSGRYTDKTQTVTVRLRDDGTADLEDPGTLVFETNDLQSYHENTLAGDVRFAWQGFLAQGEAAVRKVNYDTPPEVDGSEALVLGVPLGTTAYRANYIGYAFYGLLAYELPLGDLLGGVLLTPYGSVERSVPADAAAALDQWQYRFGLNVKPSPYITNKVEVIRVDPENPVLGELTSLYLQTAVAF